MYLVILLITWYLIGFASVLFAQYEDRKGVLVVGDLFLAFGMAVGGPPLAAILLFCVFENRGWLKKKLW